MKHLALSALLLAASATSGAAASVSALRSRRGRGRRAVLVEDPEATPAEPAEPAEQAEQAEPAGNEPGDAAQLSPLDAALAAVKQTEDTLEGARSGLRDKITSVQEASVAVTAGTANASSTDYAKHQSTLDSDSDAIVAAAESLPAAREAAKKARQEARRVELAAIREQAAAAAAAADASASASASEAGSVVASASGSEAVSAAEAPTPHPSTQDARVPLLQELIQATKDHTSAQSKYAESALALQMGMARNGTDAKAAAEATALDDPETAADAAEIEANARESEAHKLLMAPGRAQAQAHCADPVLRIAGFKWCAATFQCLQSWEKECPGGEWNGQVKKEMSVLTEQLSSLREQKVLKQIEEMRANLEHVKKVAGLDDGGSSAAKKSDPAADPYATTPKGIPPLVSPAGPGTYGRLKGHVIQLRAQVMSLSQELKMPVPDDPYAKTGLPVPAAYQAGAGAAGQGSHVSELTARLGAVVNEIAHTKHGSAMALLNREADAIMTSLRTMTMGAHCNRCGRGHCDVHPRDTFLWPDLPKDKGAAAAMCGCASLANPKCPCPAQSCPDPKAAKAAQDAAGQCGCLKKKKKKCPCDKGGGKHAPCGGPGQPRCLQPPTMCQDPGTPMHAVRLGQTYSEGSKLQFLCQPPYKLVGDEFRTCRADARTADTPTGDGNGGVRRGGDWTGKQPTCVAPSCGTPDPPIEDGIMIGSDFRFPAKIEFKCNEGYSMEGSKLAQCLGSGQWNMPTPRCYPLQHASEGLSKQFGKAQAEIDEIAAMLGEESTGQRETKDQKEEDAADAAKAKEDKKEKEEQEEQEKKAEEKEEQEEAEKEAELAQKAPEPGSVSQLASVAKHAQLELKRAEANRKDVEALVLANSGATSMAEAYGKTSALISSTDPLKAEAAAEKRNQIIQDLLASGSPLYRSQAAEVDNAAETKATYGRAAASAGSNIAANFAKALLDNLAKGQAQDPNRAVQDQEERKQVLAEVATAASAAAFAEGKIAADEAAAIKAGKVSGAAAAAATLAPLFGTTADQLLAQNAGLLESEIRSSLGTLNGGAPATPAELVASTEDAAVAAAEQQEASRAKSKQALKTAKANAVKDVKKKIEEKLLEAEKAGQGGEAAEAESALKAVVGEAQLSAADQLEQVADADAAAGATGNAGDLTNVENTVTSSIADEAVKSILKVHEAATGSEEDAAAEAAEAKAKQQEAVGEAAGRVAEAGAEAAEAAEQEAEEVESEKETLEEASSEAVQSNPAEAAGAAVAAQAA